MTTPKNRPNNVKKNLARVSAIFGDKMAALFFFGSRVKLKKTVKDAENDRSKYPRETREQQTENNERVQTRHQDPLRTGWGAENAKVCENASLGEAKWHHPAFLVASIYSLFCKTFKSYMTSGQCYNGNIFLINLSFSFLLCSKSGKAIQYSCCTIPTKTISTGVHQVLN